MIQGEEGPISRCGACGSWKWAGVCRACHLQDMRDLFGIEPKEIPE